MKNVTLGLNTSRRDFIKNTSLAAAGLCMAPGMFKNNVPGDPELITRYGCLFQNAKPLIAEQKMTEAGFDLVRVPVFLSEEFSKQGIDNYLTNGFSVQINLNWNKTQVPSDFPTPSDYPEARKMAKKFFDHYRPYKDQIPLLCLGNEWDNLSYHSNSIIYYVYGLRLIVDLAHEFGFKVADAGITSTSTKRWMYSQLSGAEALLWKKNYWVAEDRADYQPLMQRIQFYIDHIQSVPIDYLNMHWYNIDHTANGFPKAAGTYLKQCGKTEIITNEFGIKTPELGLWKSTVKEVSSYQTDDGDKTTRFALAYSAQVNRPDNAIRLTDPMLAELANKTSGNIIS